MVINGSRLLAMAPIKDMLDCKVSNGLVSHGLGEAGYDIRLKQDVSFYMRSPGADPVINIGGEHSRGRFCLASAMEEFDMPSNLVGIVHDKSTWARKGLSVFNTVIEPGWKGFLTLELVYHGGPAELHIPAGSGIAQVIFHQTSDVAEYSGKYQHQRDEPVGPIYV